MHPPTRVELDIVHGSGAGTVNDVDVDSHLADGAPALRAGGAKMHPWLP